MAFLVDVAWHARYYLANEYRTPFLWYLSLGNQSHKYPLLGLDTLTFVHVMLR